jgi:cytochrome d ubiquinol oxidase subunit I
MRAASISLLVFCALYSFLFGFGIYYIHQLLRAGPGGRLVLPPAAGTPNRPMSVVDGTLASSPHHLAAGE